MTNDDNRDLVVDLHDLWFAENCCTDMAGAHSDAAGTVSGCNAESALSRPSSIGLGASGYSADWSILRDQVLSMLNTNARSLDDTATAMQVCAQTFTSTDEDVAEDLRDRKEAIPYG